ncbi:MULTISPECIES: AAA family ATPase [Bacteroides]|uniref:AAA family ATPase n=1 Tax=Bacteroides TaxID=816 RepID=UPI00283AB2CF|nr:AAA family ATPase [Bacteroides fragilis]
MTKSLPASFKLSVFALSSDSYNKIHCFINGKTCIILDEIQECKEARTALKSFHIDGRFDVIATGSLLGVKGYGKSKKKRKRRKDKILFP